MIFSQFKISHFIKNRILGLKKGLIKYFTTTSVLKMAIENYKNAVKSNLFDNKIYSDEKISYSDDKLQTGELIIIR